MPTVIYSTADLGGANIADKLRGLFDFREVEPVEGNFRVWKNGGVTLAEIRTEHIFADYIDQHFHDDFIIFASRHRSESRRPTLCVHPCGNWEDKAEFGGRPRTLEPTTALPMKAALKFIAESSLPEGFEVTYEATHHGPHLSTPFFFVEIGSTEREWVVPELGELLARAIMRACEAREGGKVAIGIGGIHYEEKFTKRALESGVAMGHMCPKHHIDAFDAGMARQAVEKTVEKAELALIDWKSLKALEREKAMKVLEEIDLPWEKV